jgi:LysR family glycine cleavage system transcriptional activator
LTKDGKELYLVAHKVVLGYKKGFDIFSSQKRKLTICINAPQFIAMELLIPEYAKLRILDPNLDLRITSTETLTNLSDHMVDACIRFGHGTWPETNARHLTSANFVTVCSPEYRLQNDFEMSPIKDKRFYESQTIITAFKYLEDWIEIFPDFQPKDVIYAGSLHAALKIAENGMGIALSVAPTIHKYIKHNNIELVDRVAYFTSNSYWFVTPTDRDSSPALEFIHHWLINAFDELRNLAATTEQTPPRIRPS